MVNIVNGKEVTFSRYRFNEGQARSFFENYRFTNQRNITRSMVTWFAYTFSDQSLLDVNEIFHLEHIFSKKRQEMEGGLQNSSAIESLGNKVLLEGSINIRASDYRFEDKKKIYSGEQRRGKNKDATKVHEIHEVLKLEEFGETQINERNGEILDKFFAFLHDQDLIEAAD